MLTVKLTDANHSISGYFLMKFALFWVGSGGCFIQIKAVEGNSFPLETNNPYHVNSCPKF